MTKSSDFPSHEDQVDEIIKRAVGSGAKHFVLYAHGGLNNVKGSASRVGDWWDKFIERSTQLLGHALWKEMQSDAELAFKDGRAGTRTLEMLIRRLGELGDGGRQGGRPGRRVPKLHLVGHSAGSIWHAHLLKQWAQLGGPKIENLILFAPACTGELYNDVIYPAAVSGTVGKLHHFLLLDDETEKADTVGGIYQKSLLYLVSRSYQERSQVVPIMDMEMFEKKLRDDGSKRFNTYNTKDNRDKTTSTSHGGFDNDPATMNSMMKLIAGSGFKKFKDEELKGY